MVISIDPLRETAKLKFGNLYLVESEDFGTSKITKARRIFKGFEDRKIGNLPAIKCAVFTSRVNKDVKLTKTQRSYTLSGKRLPRKELSLPLYLLKKVETI